MTAKELEEILSDEWLPEDSDRKEIIRFIDKFFDEKWHEFVLEHKMLKNKCKELAAYIKRNNIVI